MGQLLTRSKKEFTRLEVMQRMAEKRLKQKEAAEILRLSERHLRRLLRAYRQHGESGLLSKRRGQPSNNRLRAEVKQQAIDLLHSRYPDFEPTLAHEKLSEVHQLNISQESVRQVMIAQELWKPRKVKRQAVHQMRPRRACLGELVQVDGSPHAWFEDRAPACSLLVYVDDASGRLMELYFTPVESTFSYFSCHKALSGSAWSPTSFLQRPGQHFQSQSQTGPFWQRDDPIWTGHAGHGIEIISAHTPQAKGRVERANDTLQDRLVKELRLQNISTIQAANTFAPEYLPGFNRRFALQPRSNHDTRRPQLFSEAELDQIFSLQETRTLSKNLTLQYKKVLYQVQTSRVTYALRKAQVTVCENPTGQVSILY